ncbi:MAG TPA: AI-2E family transporter [Terriglobales bacterium]|nr:AI-2E family transporter [Terriglobales bacterium]
MDRKLFLTLLAFAGLALLLYLLAAILEPFLVPLAWAGVIAIATYPVYERLLGRLGNREGRTAGVMVLGVALIIIVPAVVLAFLLAEEAARFYGTLNQATEGGGLVDLARLQRHPVFGPPVRMAVEGLGRLGVNLDADLAPAAKGAMKFVANYAASAVKNVLLFLLQLFIVVFSLFFLYRDGKRIQRGFWSVLPVEEEEKRALEGSVTRILPSVLTGVLLTALVQGILGGIGFWISGLSSPIFFGALICVASLLPVVGTMLVWLPGALYLLFQGMTWSGIFLLAWGFLVVSSSDNILRPLLSRRQSGLPISLLMLGSLGGLFAFGLVGVILGPVVIGISLVLLEMYETPESAAPPASPQVKE